MESCRIDGCLVREFQQNKDLLRDIGCGKIGIYTSDLNWATVFNCKYHIEHFDPVDAMANVVDIVRKHIARNKIPLLEITVADDAYGIPQTFIALTNEGENAAIEHVYPKYVVQSYNDQGIFADGFDDEAEAYKFWRFYKQFVKMINVLELAYTEEGLKYERVCCSVEDPGMDMHADTVLGVSTSWMWFKIPEGNTLI